MTDGQQICGSVPRFRTLSRVTSIPTALCVDLLPVRLAAPTAVTAVNGSIFGASCWLRHIPLAVTRLARPLPVRLPPDCAI